MSENVQTFSGKVNVADNLLVGTSHFFVDRQNNRVGIGTSTPDASSMLDVTGNIKSGGTITATGGFSGNGSGLTGVNSDSGSWVNGSSSNIHLAVSTDKVGIGVLDPSHKLDVNGDINIASGSTLRVGGTPAVFSNWSVDGSDIYRSSGNVGIGVTSPGYPLQVDGTIKLSTGTNDASGGEFNIDGNVGHIRRKIGGNGVSYTSYDDHQFYTNATGGAAENGGQSMVIKSNGNVGIGESSPAELVHIRGNGPHMLIEGASNENGQIDFSSGPSYRNRRHQIESRHYALSGNGYRNWLAFRVNEGGQGTPNTRMVIRGDGRVCIGQDHTTAVALLDIKDGRTGTSPNHNLAFYVTTGINATGPGPEIRHTNQSQGIGFGYQSIYATGNNSNQPINIISRGTDRVYIKNYSSYSDDRIKTNEEYITNATETLMKLKPQIYDKHEKINEICDDPTREAGLIAQDVYYDAPELRYLVSARNDGIDDEPAVNIPEEKPFVDDDPTKDPDYSGWGNASAGIAYIQLVPYLIKAVQEIHQTHQTTKTELKADLSETKADLSETKADLQTTKEDLQSKATLEDLQTVKTQLQTTNEQNQKLEARIAFLETALISR